MLNVIYIYRCRHFSFCEAMKLTAPGISFNLKPKMIITWFTWYLWKLCSITWALHICMLALAHARSNKCAMDPTPYVTLPPIYTFKTTSLPPLNVAKYTNHVTSGDEVVNHSESRIALNSKSQWAITHKNVPWQPQNCSQVLTHWQFWQYGYCITMNTVYLPTKQSSPWVLIDQL